MRLSIWNVWDERNLQWIDSGADYWLGAQGQLGTINRYVNMPGYTRPREFELSFTKNFAF
jgi:hypothetical protein